MNLNVSLRARSSLSPVVIFSTPNNAQTMSLRKMGYAVLPARIRVPMVISTKYESWNGIMLASSKDIPELLNADAPLNTPNHQGFIPFFKGGPGWLLLIHAPSARQPRN